MLLLLLSLAIALIFLGVVINPLEQVLYSWSPVDHWTLGQALEGTNILSSPGGGKTSNAGAQLSYALLRQGYGGLIICFKRDDAQMWADRITKAGRAKDIIHFSVDSGHVFDPFHYAYNRSGRGAKDTEELIDLLAVLLSVGKPHTGYSADRFWELASEQLMRTAIKALAMAGEPISLVTINQVVDSLPTRPGEFEEEGWQNDSYCASLISKIRDRKDSLSDNDWSDLDLITRYICRTFPQMDERPRSSIVMTWKGMCDKLLYQPWRRLFSGGKCTFIPEQTTHAGKIVLLDFPIVEYNETGVLIACMMKLVFYRAWLRRDVSERPQPVFCIQDEFAAYLLPGSRENRFAAVSRSARVANIFITQNILGIADSLGEQQPGSKTKNFLGNNMLKIFMAQSDTDTNRYASELIGKESRYMRSTGIGGSSGLDMNAGRTEHLMYSVEPDEFTRLHKPGPAQPIAEAIVYQGGAPFASTRDEQHPEGRNFLRTGFSRNIA